MTPTWAQRREELLSDCLVSPDVFHQMLDRLGEFVVPYQRPPTTPCTSTSRGTSFNIGIAGRAARTSPIDRCFCL
jgi:hypothetical protein